MKTSRTTITLALTAAIGIASIVHAADNHSLNLVSHGNRVTAADDKAQDGKCS